MFTLLLKTEIIILNCCLLMSHREITHINAALVDLFPMEVNPFLHIYSSKHIEEKSFRKALWKRVKLLKMSNFTFSPQHFLCNLYLNPIPIKPWFLRVCSTSPLKTLWEKEKLQFHLFPQCFLSFWISSLFLYFSWLSGTMKCWKNNL